NIDTRVYVIFTGKAWYKLIQIPSLSPGYHPLKLLFIALCSLWVKTIAIAYLGFNLSIHSAFDLIVTLFNPIGSLLILLGFCFYFKKRINKVIFITSIFL